MFEENAGDVWESWVVCVDQRYSIMLYVWTRDILSCCMCGPEVFFQPACFCVGVSVMLEL